LFAKDNGNKINPGPGTCLDSVLVQNQGDKLFDFFLIPHKATVATAQPVHYDIVYNSSLLNKDQIEHVTYHLCYNYYNFGGPIKVPSACMYALKMANYAHENNVVPNEKLSSYLHFL
jgi:aubergine-like protein